MAKRRKMPMPDAEKQKTTATPDASDVKPEEQLTDCDVTTFSIDDAFAYQQTHQMNLEAFINLVATKMKFKVSDKHA